jgi:hypothetical protein
MAAGSRRRGRRVAKAVGGGRGERREKRGARSEEREGEHEGREWTDVA